MKTKINQISTLKDKRGVESDIFRRFRYAFYNILSSSGREETYIHDFETEQKLLDAFNIQNNTLLFLIGYAGIGKSTVLRYFYGFKNASPLIDEEKRAIIFPNIFNGNLMNWEEDKFVDELSRRICTVCSLLERKYPELREIARSEAGQEELYEYICETNPHILQHVSYEEVFDLDRKQELLLRLSKAERKDPLIFTATRLKYYLGKRCCGCDKIVILVDDVEPLSYKAQKYLVLQYSKLFDCMQNVASAVKEKDYLVKVIFSVRPYTYRHLLKERDFMAYFISTPIYKSSMIDLAQYFTDKVKKYEPFIPNENKKSWDDAIKALDILCTKFQSYYQNLIKTIAIGNTRDAIELTSRVLMNRIWVEKDIEKSSSFTVNLNDYVFNNITVLRAISCENYYVYNPRRLVKSYVPNIFNNSPDHNSGVIALLILAYFSDSGNMDCFQNAYGQDSVDCISIIQLFDEIFPDYPNIERYVWETLVELYNEKILRKAINDITCSEEDDDPLLKESLIYLSPRGHRIRQLLSADSVYLELCREDVYRDYTTPENNPKSSYELLQEGKQVDIFKDLCNILSVLIEEEMNLIQYSCKYNTISEYKKYFGAESVCRWIYNGIENSVRFSGSLSLEKLDVIIQSLENKVIENERAINVY